MLNANRIHEAKILYERLIELEPNHADAWFMLGVIHGDTGLPDIGIQCLERALEIDPALPDAHLNLANLLMQRGQTEPAIAHLQQSVVLDPEYAEAWMLLGRIHGETGQYVDAAQFFQKALALWPESQEVRFNLANALSSSGRINDAVQHLQSLLPHQPNNPDVLSSLADMLQRTHRHTEAETLYRRLLISLPTDIRGQNGLTEALLSQGRFQEAEMACRSALSLQPDSFQAHANLGTLLQVKGQLDGARRHLERAVSLAPENAVAHYKLAGIVLAMGDLLEAETHCRKAVELNPDFIEARSALASIHEHAGEYDRAWHIIKPLVESGCRSPHVLTAYANLSHRYDKMPEAIELLTEVVENEQLASTTRAQICHELGNLYDRARDYHQAFLQHHKANRMKENRFDPASHADRISRTIATCSKDFLRTGLHAVNESELPVFIVGMPRSGTSLVEQILSSHPGVYGAGELPDIMQIASSVCTQIRTGTHYPECLRETMPALLDDIANHYLEKLRSMNAAAVRITDKMPHNFLHLGLIQMLFPRARVIHIERNPMDTCVSIYFQEFSSDHAYAYDLGHLSLYYREYQRLMHHWEQVLGLSLLKIRYEDLVNDQENWSRRMIEFLDLEWDDRCLKFFENTRHVATPSYDQVRQPIYTVSVERWRRYERHLGPLISGLESVMGK